MAVYRNTVMHGAVEALRANFPVVEQILGAEMFESVAVDFAAECPPRRPVLALYGEPLRRLARGAAVGRRPAVSAGRRARRAPARRMPDGRRRRAARPGAGPAAIRSADVRLPLHPSVRFDLAEHPGDEHLARAPAGRSAPRSRPSGKPEGALFVRPSPFVVHAPRIGAAAHRMLFGLRLGETRRRLHGGRRPPLSRRRLHRRPRLARQPRRVRRARLRKDFSMTTQAAAPVWRSPFDLFASIGGVAPADAAAAARPAAGHRRRVLHVRPDQGRRPADRQRQRVRALPLRICAAAGPARARRLRRDL